MDIIELDGVVTPDGTLQLDSTVPLPPGKVRVTVQPAVAELPDDDPFMQRMRGIWAMRERAGLVPRTEEQVRALRKELNDQMQEEVDEAGRLQLECRRLRDEEEARRNGS